MLMWFFIYDSIFFFFMCNAAKLTFLLFKQKCIKSLFYLVPYSFICSFIYFFWQHVFTKCVRVLTCLPPYVWVPSAFPHTDLSSPHTRPLALTSCDSAGARRGGWVTFTWRRRWVEDEQFLMGLIVLSWWRNAWNFLVTLCLSACV